MTSRAVYTGFQSRKHITQHSHKVFSRELMATLSNVTAICECNIRCYEGTLLGERQEPYMSSA